MYFTGEMVEKIKQSMQEIGNGESLTISTAQEVNELLGL